MYFADQFQNTDIAKKLLEKNVVSFEELIYIGFIYEKRVLGSSSKHKLMLNMMEDSPNLINFIDWEEDIKNELALLSMDHYTYRSQDRLKLVFNNFTRYLEQNPPEWKKYKTNWDEFVKKKNYILLFFIIFFFIFYIFYYFLIIIFFFIILFLFLFYFFYFIFFRKKI